MSAPRKPTSFRWLTTIRCDGGPVLIADVASLAEWTGSRPFVELRTEGPDAMRRFGDRRNVLAFHGTLGGAGERYVPCANEADAIAAFERLIATARGNVPDLEVTSSVGDDGIERTRLVDPSSGGRLEIELEPSSEYHASWLGHPDEDAWSHDFGDGARGCFWHLGGRGDVDVGVAGARDAMLLVRAWPREDAIHREGLAATASAARELASRAPVATVGELAITSGRVAATWSPFAGRDLRAGPHEDGVSSVFYSGLRDALGIATPLASGTYRVSVGESGRDEAVRARWCRIELVGR